MQAEIKDQIKFQAAGTSIRSPAEVRERNFSSPKSLKIGGIPNRGVWCGLEGSRYWLLPRSKGHGLEVDETGGTLLLFSAGCLPSSTEKLRQSPGSGHPSRGSGVMSAQKLAFEYLFSRWVPRMPSAMLSTGAVLASVSSSFAQAGTGRQQEQDSG